jgi:hypothetical protein
MVMLDNSRICRLKIRNGNWGGTTDGRFTQWSLVAWESMAKHEEFGKSEVFPSFLKLVEPNVDMPGPPAIIHVKLAQVSGNKS